MPDLSRTAAARLGFDADAPMVRAALARRSSDASVDRRVGQAQMGAEVAHGALEVYHAVHEIYHALRGTPLAGEAAAATTAGAIVGVAGVAAGIGAHVWAEGRHEKFLADMNAMTR